jgi:hypothetical protein
MVSVYQLRNDTDHIKKVQKATLTTEQYGVQPTHGLFGSDEWWQKIASGELPMRRLRGAIIRVYMGSMGDWPEFVMRTDDGEESSWTRFADSRELSELYGVGKRIELDYVIQRNRVKAPIQAGEETRCVIEIRIGGDA